MVGLKSPLYSLNYSIEKGDEPYGNKLQEIKQRIESSNLLVGFNIKFDLNWIRRYVPDIRFPRIWDCQLGAFLLSNQTSPYPSLDSVCSSLDLGSKRTDLVAEYWSNGIDTDRIPDEILSEYLTQDLALTEQVYLKQRELLSNNTLFKLQCQDLLVLSDMENNGLRYDRSKSKTTAEELNAEITDIDKQLNTIAAMDCINWNSTDHVSAILFGGSINVPAIIPTQRVLKSGEIKHGTKRGFEQIKVAGLLEPDKKTETLPTKEWSEYKLQVENAKRKESGQTTYERVYSVSKESLRSCKAKGKAKIIIDLLLRRSEVEKLLSTYFRGIPETMEECGQTDFIHGQFNQCVARTGRLSSSNPNLQNIAKEVKKIFITRYESRP